MSISWLRGKCCIICKYTTEWHGNTRITCSSSGSCGSRYTSGSIGSPKVSYTRDLIWHFPLCLLCSYFLSYKRTPRPFFLFTRVMDLHYMISPCLLLVSPYFYFAFFCLNPMITYSQPRKKKLTCLEWYPLDVDLILSNYLL